jgi:[ribosomal protein S18]-alanine N-acetyltransferase
MDIRDMAKADLPAVLKIETDLFPTDAWTEALFLGELSEVPVSRKVAVAEFEGQVIGYVSLRFVGRQGDVNTIAIAKDFQRKGFGNQLLAWLLMTAKDLGVRELFLDVRADNLAAIEMYKKAGFDRIDIRRNYYDHSVDADVMRKKLT